MTARDLASLEGRLGYPFKDRSLLTRALTHSSYAHEEEGGADNEPLEFFGDAALGFFVAGALLRRYPDLDEGGLSKFKAFVVSRSNLAEVARRLGLGAHLRLGRTAEQGHGRGKASLLADALEAVIAAVALDGGDAACRALIDRLLGAQIETLDRDAIEQKDYKTALQELLQGRGLPAPRYRVVETEGPAHKPVFSVELSVAGERKANGRGGSKKEAEQRAARTALRVYRRPGS